MKIKETIKWIPVSESLPDDETTVLIYMPNSDEPVDVGYKNGEDWHYAQGGKTHYRVTHWTPIPEGPK